MIQPGLERIGLLLKDVQLPWKAVHVAGTNGKGSICAFASGLLTRRTIRSGRFTSPHLVNRWDCITVLDEPVSQDEFRLVEKHFMQLNQREGINASEFELLTATAFELFTKKKVEVGIVEVGMGGKLDATNILNNQMVSVISKIARDHQNFLGNTLEDITLHKAGILRPNVPYIVNPANDQNVQDTIDTYAEKIGAGPRLLLDTEQLREELYSTKEWHQFAGPLQPFQRDNAVLGYLAYREALKSLNYSTFRTQKWLTAFTKKKGKLPGRFDHRRVSAIFGLKSRREILIDGAHNPDAAAALNGYVYENLRKWKRTRKAEGRCERERPITWVLAMTEGKDARQYLACLLRPGDKVVTTTFGSVDGMPWVKSMDSKDLLRVAEEVQPRITGLDIPFPGVFRALCAAKELAGEDSPIVLTGSLYLVGDFERESQQWTYDPVGVEERKPVVFEERDRVREFLSHNNFIVRDVVEETEEEKVQDEIRILEQELQSLEVEEIRHIRAKPVRSGSGGSTNSTYRMVGCSPRRSDDAAALSTKRNSVSMPTTGGPFPIEKPISRSSRPSSSSSESTERGRDKRKVMTKPLIRKYRGNHRFADTSLGPGDKR